MPGAAIMIAPGLGARPFRSCAGNKTGSLDGINQLEGRHSPFQIGSGRTIKSPIALAAGTQDKVPDKVAAGRAFGGATSMIETSRAADKIDPWPVLRSLQGYRLAFLTSDLVAGITLTAVAIPEQLATSRLGGFSPQIGFFAFLAGSLAFAVFGSNRLLSSGADSTITPIFAGGLALLAVAGSPEYAALAGALALMVGLVLVAGGIFRLGWIADLLSIPVTVGFLAGISIHILISQMPAVLGLPSPQGAMLQRLATLLGATAAGQSLRAWHRPWRARADRDCGTDRRPDSGRPDRADRRGCYRGVRGPRKPGRRGYRQYPGGAADPHRSGRADREMAATGAADPHHCRHCHGADGGDNAIVRVGSRSAAGCRSRFHRGRSRQHRRGPDRRISGQCQPAAHRHCFGDRRPVAARRSRRRRDHPGAARIRRWPVAPRAPGRARRSPAVRRHADHPGQPDRFDLPPVACRIPFDRGDRGSHHHPAYRTRRRHWNSALAAARHLEHKPRPAHPVRTGAGNLHLVAVESEHAAAKPNPG